MYVSTSREWTDYLRAQLPLNSRRLTAGQLTCVGEALVVPMAAATEEVRQMREAKLAEDGQEPRYVQVVLEKASSGSGLTLQDEGVFLHIQPEERPSQLEGPGREDDSTHEGTPEQVDGPLEVELLRASLGEASMEISMLNAEVQTLREQP